MIPAKTRLATLLALATLPALGACHSEAPAPRAEGRPLAPVALFTTLPIAWGEVDDPREMLGAPGGEGEGDGEGEGEAGSGAHWLRGLFEAHGTFTVLDTLGSEAAPELDLPRGTVLVMAQPRALLARENVALDDWVRGGGRVLIFADPMLTEESRFAIGDPRRPQGAVLLSPILAHWGLELRFDPGGVPERGMVKIAEGSLPVEMPGQLVELGKSGTDNLPRGKMGMDDLSAPARGASGKAGDEAVRCRLEGAGILADCRIGAGHAVILADAAVLARAGGEASISARRDLVEALLARL